MKEAKWNPLRINEEDSLGVVVVKAIGQGAVQTISAYGGILGAFAVIGYVEDKVNSRKKKKTEEIVEEILPETENVEGEK
jgi:hypothetical protein